MQWLPGRLGVRGTRRYWRQSKGRAVMMVTNLKGKNYTQRLEELGLTTLEERRERGDLIQAYKVLTGKERVSF